MPEKLDSLLLEAGSTPLSANDKEELANIKKTLEMKMKHLALYDQQIEELIEYEDAFDQLFGTTPKICRLLGKDPEP